MESGRGAVDVIELLRRFALNDEHAVRRAVSGSPGALGYEGALEPKAAALVRLGSLLSVGAATASCRVTVDVARAAGASDEEIVAVLVAVAPVVGGARLVAAAPRLALAIDYDVEDVDAAPELP
jgi:alkylhydroperoxidase/carboxymuconolactone decarboxylase family protein YurZ